MHSLRCPGYHLSHRGSPPRIHVGVLGAKCIPLLRSLLVKIGLHTALSSLASIVLCLSLDLLIAVASDACDGSTYSATNAIRDTLAQIAELTLSFLALAFLVLCDTLLLETLGTDQVTNHLLARANGLVPRALLTVGVVLGDARCADGKATYGASHVREVLLCLCLGLLVLAFGL